MISCETFTLTFYVEIPFLGLFQAFLCLPIQNNLAIVNSRSYSSSRSTLRLAGEVAQIDGAIDLAERPFLVMASASSIRHEQDVLR